MKRRLLTVLVALGVVTALASPASAAPEVASTPLVGSTYVQLIAGETMTFHQVDEVTSVAYNVKRSMEQCTTGYACGWDTTGWSGTFWRYNMNNVYANTANGVAHCWNLATDARNRFGSFLNDSPDRVARFVDNINCNENAGSFALNPGGWYTSCANVSHSAWCDRVSSIRAYA